MIDFFLRSLYYLFFSREQTITQVQTSDEASSIDSAVEALQCTVCLDIFNDPRVLICDHTVCLGCCEAKEGCVICPVCKELTEISTKDKSSLPQNHALRKAIGVYEQIDTTQKKRGDISRQPCLHLHLYPHGHPELSGPHHSFEMKSKHVETKSATITPSGGTVETDGITITIPTDAVQEPTQFQVQRSSAQLPPNIVPISPIYEITPHNTRFGESITLTFDIPSSFDGASIALYKQKDDELDKELEKWLVVPHVDGVQNGKATFKVKSFCDAVIAFQPDVFVDKPISTIQPAPPRYIDQHKIIKPGVNYCVRCPTCSTHDFFIINRGYDTAIDVGDDVYGMKCYHCEGELIGEDLKNIFFYQTEGKVSARKYRARTPEKSTPITALGDNFVMCASSSTTEQYNVRIEARPPLSNPSTSSCIEVSLDAMGNYAGQGCDLGRDGAFSHIKLLVGHFYTGQGFTAQWFDEMIVGALSTKGFQIKVTRDEGEFLRSLTDYDVIWIIPNHGNPIQDQTFPQKIKNFYETGGKGILFWEDNDSIANGATNAALKLLFGFTVGGNDEGTQIMAAAPNTNSPLTFDKNHPLSRGVTQLHEGVTISYPQTPLPPDFKLFSRSSAGQPNIFYRDEQRVSNARGETVTLGRVLVDCGFTKLYPGIWQETEGTACYVINATVWLSGLHDDD